VSISSIDFVVTSAPGIQLSELLNKPNPVGSRTVFSIRHNKPATELRVLIDIFSLNGQLVKTIEENVYASGYNIPPIEWDGSDNGGTMLANGIYIFRALVSTADGDQAHKTEKLIILR
jgi:flagellar hook assembly protein FlgD